MDMRNQAHRFKEYEAFAISYSHAPRDTSNTMQLAEAFETLGLKKWVDTGMVEPIKTANMLISELRNVSHQMTLLSDDELAIKNKEMFLVCKRKFVEGSGKTSVHDHDYLSNFIYQGLE